MKGSVFVALLAGGRGTRFWPLSRAGRPKQFLRFGRERTLLQEAYARFARIASEQRILILAPEAYGESIREQLPSLPSGNLLFEPSPRDTAAAVGLAALEARRRDPNAVLVVSPSDQTVANAEAFREAIERAVERARSGGLGTLGVRPTHPSSAFGYLRTAGGPDPRAARPVERFVEKPDLATAREYVREGGYLWNAGIFIFGVEAFFAAVASEAPDLARGLERVDTARAAGGREEREVTAAWESLPRTSIDYALMEKAREVWAVPLDAGWDDLGGWAAAEKRLERDDRGNAVSETDELLVDSRRSTVFGAGDSGKLIVLIGVEDLIIVETPDVLLVCRRDSAEDIKKAVEELRRRGREDLL